MTGLELLGRYLGEFLVRDPIGVGGHGVVYRCEQRDLGLASQLDHPHSAHVYAFGAENDGVLWIAMEFVRGITLGAYLKATGPTPRRAPPSSLPAGSALACLRPRGSRPRYVRAVLKLYVRPNNGNGRRHHR
jgi:serine/threonine protein kinase